MRFVEQEDILNMFEGMIRSIFKDVKGIDYTEAVERMTWEDAMWNYGIDKPDIRFGMKVANLKVPSTVYIDKQASLQGSPFSCGQTGFGVCYNAETVVAIADPGASEHTRKQIDALTD